MANLLDQASIVLTPTAYDNGKVLCAKPSEAPYGDFDFSRNSAATRVNAQGLVENVQILSSNLVQNGDFSEEGAEEVSNGSFSQIGPEEVSNGSFSQEGVEQADDSVISNAGGSIMTKVSALNYNATSDGTGGSTVRPRLQFNNTTIGKSYRIRITPTNQSGTIDFKLYDGSQYIISGNDLTTDVDLYFKADGTNVFIAFDGTNIFNVDFEISLKEVGQGWTFLGGASLTDLGAKITHTPTAGVLQQSSILVVGKQYKFTYEITESVLGSLKLQSASVQTMDTSVGVHTKYFDATLTYLSIARTDPAGNDVTITNISVKEVGQDWDFVGGAEITEQGVRILSTGVQQSYINQTALTNTKSYKISYDIVDSTQGSLKLINVNGVSEYPIPSTIGSHTVYFTANNDILFIFRNSGATDVTITNISVKEVGMDWSITNHSGATSNIILGALNIVTDGAFTNAEQNGFLISGNNYSLTYTIISNAVVGNLQATIGNASVSILIPSTVGTHSIKFTAAGSGAFAFKRGGGALNVSITNISVIEITDDTNLPRISYENFSYQDALGSELVTNGDFSNGATDWILTGLATIGNGVASFVDDGTNTNTAVTQINVISINKTYKVTFDIVRYVLGGVQLRLGNATAVTNELLQGVGSYTMYINSGSIDGNYNFQIKRWGGAPNFDFDIDNVSVKEYLGQEVVPNSGCGSWLFESQSTNLITQSELFSGGSWGNYNSTTTDNQTTAPDGLLTASKFSGTSDVTAHTLYLNAYPVVSGNDYTYSVFAKKNESNFIQINTGQGFGNLYANFDLDNGVVGSFNTLDADIEPYLNGWFKCSVKANSSTATGQSTFSLIQSLTDLRNPSFNALNNSVYIWGAQLEQQSYATSYIPTSGSTVTRNQDVCDSLNIPSLLGQTEGTFFIEINKSVAGAEIFSFNRSTNNSFQVFTDNTNYKVLSYYEDGYYNRNTSIHFTDTIKMAVSYKNNELKLYANGTEFSSSNVFTWTPNDALANLYFNKGGYVAANKKSEIKALAVWKEALSDEELADLTYPTPTDPTFSLDFDTIAEQFTFARGSEATYVDAQGLIQSTNEIGSELILNGSFDSDTAWTKTGEATISGGYGNIISTTGASSELKQTILQIGVTYKYSVEVVSISSGGIQIYNGSPLQIATSIGTYTGTFVATNAQFRLIRNGVTNGSIDNVSVKEVTTATNTPRLDYSTGAEAFLLEPQSTNLIPYSEDFSDSSWIKSNANIISNYAISPSGILNASRFLALSQGFLYDGFNVTINSIYTISFWVKSNGGLNNFFLHVSGNNSPTFTATDVWQRFEHTFTAVNTSHNIGIACSSSGADLQIWGAQLEQQSYATSYIPSNGSQTTRNQETCINATPEINSEEGVLYFEGAILGNDGTYKIVSLSDGTTLNVVRFYYSITDNRIVGNVKSGSVIVFNFNHALQDSTDFLKTAISYRLNDFKMYVNGTKVASNTAGNAPIGLNVLTFNNGGGTSPFFGNTKDVQVYTKALSDAELIKLTT